MFKHGLIQSPAYWEKMKQLSALTTDDLEEIIYESVVIKHQVVKQDPKEQGLRKILNFGHTLGHAIESYCLALQAFVAWGSSRYWYDFSGFPLS